MQASDESRRQRGPQDQHHVWIPATLWRVYVKAKKMLESGAIGKVREVHGEFLKFALKGDEPVLPAPRTEEEKLRQWKLWRATFGEVIVETYVHNLDAINWFMGAHP